MANRAAALQLPEIANDVLEGLSASPKTLPPKLFYDAEGSRLFDEITRLPEYYPTRLETRIFQECAGEIVRAAGDQLDVVELGAGMATKTRLLLHEVLKRQLSVRFTPVDISADALEVCSESLKREMPRVSVSPCVTDFTTRIPKLPGTKSTRLMLYIGSSIGNFDPEDAQALLTSMRKALRPGDALLLGTDLRKDEATLVAAYDDAQGVTAQFNKNVLARINRELGADFQLEKFRHVALWNSEESRIEMHLESTERQSVWIKTLRVRVNFDTGESIHTENSYKYTLQDVERMLRVAGFKRERTWTDPKEWYAVHMARAV
jgi:dimethylhistidine N-methyltransferase